MDIFVALKRTNTFPSPGAGRGSSWMHSPRRRELMNLSPLIIPLLPHEKPP
jgi:hypothetical protein